MQTNWKQRIISLQDRDCWRFELLGNFIQRKNFNNQQFLIHCMLSFDRKWGCYKRWPHNNTCNRKIPNFQFYVTRSPNVHSWIDMNTQCPVCKINNVDLCSIVPTLFRKFHSTMEQLSEAHALQHLRRICRRNQRWYCSDHGWSAFLLCLSQPYSGVSSD